MASVHIYLFVLGLLICSTTCFVDSRPSFSRSVRQRLVEALRSRRTQQECISSTRKCFTSAQCCRGLVCAAFDYYLGEKPEMPGYCVREKELQPCDDNDDCPLSTRCVSLSQSSDSYCLPTSHYATSYQPARRPGSQSDNSVTLVGGGLGAACSTDADCAELTSDRSARLCCQDVRRGRQGIRRQCDRYNERLSVCISQ